MAKWSEMLDEIIYEVAKRLPPDVEEFARFSCVSKSWRSSAITLKQQNIAQHAPWLLLAKRENDEWINADSEEGIRSFYSISSGKVFNLKLPTQGRRCWGTPYSWLFTMGLDLHINLLNPFSRLQIPLPSQPTFEHQYPGHREPQNLCGNFINKIALSSNPSSWNSNASASTTPVVMVTYGEFCYLAMAAPGDEAWTSFEGYLGDNISDIIFHDSHFYVVNHRGTVGICDITTTPPTATEIASPPEGFVNFPYRNYLVEISGNLYLVGRAYEADTESEDGDEDESELERGDEEDDESEPEEKPKDGNEEESESEEPEDGGEEETELEDHYHTETTCFVVFKFDFHTKKWSEVKILDDHALFVGNNQSFAISTASFSKFRGNCIYFTDDDGNFYDNDLSDMGVYDMGKGIVKPFYISDDKVSEFSRAVFFMPTP